MLKNGRFFVALGKLLRSVRKDRLIEAEKTRLNCKLQAAASGAKIGRGQDSGFADLHRLGAYKMFAVLLSWNAGTPVFIP